jgi:hypothetical protein
MMWSSAAASPRRKRRATSPVVGGRGSSPTAPSSRTRGLCRGPASRTPALRRRRTAGWTFADAGAPQRARRGGSAPGSVAAALAASGAAGSSRRRSGRGLRGRRGKRQKPMSEKEKYRDRIPAERPERANKRPSGRKSGCEKASPGKGLWTCSAPGSWRSEKAPAR